MLLQIFQMKCRRTIGSSGTGRSDISTVVSAARPVDLIVQEATPLAIHVIY